MWQEPRSANYGSPQWRQRIYLYGARKDVVDRANFAAGVRFFKETLPALHQRAEIADLVAQIEATREHTHVEHIPCKPQDMVF